MNFDTLTSRANVVTQEWPPSAVWQDTGESELTCDGWKRKKYTAEFKARAVRMISEEGVSVREAARHLKVSESMLYRWRDALRRYGERAFPGNGQLRFKSAAESDF